MPLRDSWLSRGRRARPRKKRHSPIAQEAMSLADSRSHVGGHERLPWERRARGSSHKKQQQPQHQGRGLLARPLTCRAMRERRVSWRRRKCRRDEQHCPPPAKPGQSLATSGPLSRLDRKRGIQHNAEPVGSLLRLQLKQKSDLRRPLQQSAARHSRKTQNFSPSMAGFGHPT